MVRERKQKRRLLLAPLRAGNVFFFLLGNIQFIGRDLLQQQEWEGAKEMPDWKFYLPTL